ncbi:MAG: M16 family metallopeptidase [Candidatus Melainabacteria bacterium]
MTKLSGLQRHPWQRAAACFTLAAIISLPVSGTLTGALTAEARPISQTTLADTAQTPSPVQEKVHTTEHGTIYEYALPTGHTLFVQETHDQPIITIDTWVKTGSVNETPEINGVSHFLEHLLFKGTPSHPAGDIERILESHGAEFNAATSDDYTHYYITTATPYFEEALGLHADMLLNASIPPDELLQERKVVQEEINRATDNPKRQLFITLSREMYGPLGYGLDTLGPKENIASIPRDKILNYYHYWYQPKNFNTIIVGDVDHHQVRDLVSRLFPAPAFAKPAGYTPPVVGTPAGLRQTTVRTLERPGIASTYLTLSWLGPSIKSQKDMLALDVATLALGSGESSRLYKALVEQPEKPLALSVSAGNMTQRLSGLLYVDAQIPNATLPQAQQAIADVLKEAKTNGITQEELDKAKTQILKEFVFLNETTEGIANTMGYNVTIGSLKDYTDYVSDIQKVGLAEVKSALQRYLDDNRALAIEMIPQGTLAPDEQTRQLTAMMKNTAPVLSAQNEETLKAAAVNAVGENGLPVETTTLPNGMQLILKPNPASETVALKFFLPGGKSAETIPGTAALVSQVLTQGTRHRSAEMISHELESQGMSLDVSSAEDYITVSANALHNDLAELFLVLSDVLNNPAFADAEIARCKELTRQAIKASRENPSTVAFENLTLSMYDRHNYGNVGKRVESHLNQIRRDDLTAFYSTNFHPENMVVVAVGNFKPEHLKTLLQTSFSGGQNSNPSTRVAATRPAETGNSSTPVFHLDSLKNAGKPPALSETADTESDTGVATQESTVAELAASKTVQDAKENQGATWIAQGWLAPPISNQRDYVAIKVLNSLLGGGMSSRLFNDLREKQGLAYVVSSMYPSRKDKSQFVMYIGTDPVNQRRVLAGFNNEIRRLKNQPVGLQELQEAKDKLIGGNALAHETNDSQAFYLGLYHTLGVGYQFDKRYPELIQQVTPDDIQRVARLYFSRPHITSIVAPGTSSAEQAKR